MSNDDSFSYIGRSKCGCIQAAQVDNPNHAKKVARSVAEFIRDGLTVERVPSQYVRDNLRRCLHEPVEPEQLEMPV